MRKAYGVMQFHSGPLKNTTCLFKTLDKAERAMVYLPRGTIVVEEYAEDSDIARVFDSPDYEAKHEEWLRRMAASSPPSN